MSLRIFHPCGTPRYALVLALSLVIAFMILAVAQSAQAGLIISQGPGNFAGDDNVIFNVCSGTTSGPALNVQGCLNGDHSILVNFRSDEPLVVSGGQAKIEADDGAFQFLEIGLFDPDLVFSTLIVNIKTKGGKTGDITFSAELVNPDVFYNPLTAYSLANGQNFFLISTTDAQLIDTLSFISEVPIKSISFQDVRQVRIGGITDPGPDPIPPIPEPSTLALFAFGLAGLGIMTRRSRRSPSRRRRHGAAL